LNLKPQQVAKSIKRLGL